MSKSKRKATGKQDSRPTIALITDQVVYEYQADIATGVIEVAHERDVNLLCFVGGRLHSPAGFESQGNVIYDLASAESVDGVVIMASAVGSQADFKEVGSFCEGFRPLPIVSIGLALEGISSLVVDNEKGLRDVLVHLVEHHGCRRIAFIRGPETNKEAELRYRTYINVLEESGLPFDPDLVAPGDFLRPSGVAAINLLLDERRADFDAVVTANDDMALGALEALQARGIRVPDDVAVVGFDDVEETEFVTPPLTTVRQSLYEQGKQAAEMLLALLAGEKVPEMVTLPTEAVIRQSCGCPPPAALQAKPEEAAKKKGQAADAAVSAQRESILSGIMQAAGPSVGFTSEQAEQLLDAFADELSGKSPSVFLPTLNSIMSQAVAAGGSVATWYAVLSTLRQSLLPHLDEDSLLQAEAMWLQARVLIGEAARRVQGYQALQAEVRNRTLWQVGAALITMLDLESSMDVLAEGLPRVGISSAYLSLYEDPQPYAYPQPAPEWSRLVLAYDEANPSGSEGGSGELKRIDLGIEGQRFPSHRLVPEGLLPQERQYCLVVRPLFFQQDQIGFVLFGAGQQELVTCETLSTQVSSTLQGVRVLEDRRRAEQTLMEERNLLRTLIDNLPDHIYAKDTTGRFTLGNMAVARHMGATTPDELIGKSDFDFYPSDLAAQFHADEQALIQSGQSVLDHEEPTRDPTGRPKWTLTTKVLLRDSQEKVIGLVGVGRDITERRRAELALQRRALQLQTAAEVSRAASSILDLDALIQQVVNLIRERFDLYYAGLFLVDEEGSAGEPGKWAVLRAGTGEAGQQMIARGHKLEIGGASMIGTCVANKQARIALDVGEEAVRFENPFLPETRSELALPLISRGEVIGALTIQSAQEVAFSDEDIAVLQTMADQLANVIANARLYRALAREQYLMQALMENVPDYIYFKDDESRFIMTTNAHLKTFGLSDPARIVGKSDFDFFSEEHARQAYEDEQRIIKTGEPILGIEERETWPDRPDTWVLTSKMPLRDEADNIVGTFGISRDITPLKQAEMVLERRALQLQTAAEVSHAGSSILDPDELIRQVVDLVRERFDLYYAGLFLVDEAGGWAVLRAGTGEAGQQMLERGHRLEVGGESMVGRCITAKAARIALDVGEEAVRFENPLLPETRSELALPLISRGEAIGALTIQSTQEAAFSDEDVAVLQTMADQLANAVQNARLFDQAQTQAGEMSVLSEVAQTLSTRLTAQEVLDEVHQAASRLLDATNFYIALYDPDTDQVSFPFDTTQEESDRFLTLPADQGITGYIIRHREGVLIEENVAERLAEMGITMVGEPALSWLGVPMVVGDQVLGVMGVQSFTAPRVYDEHDRDLLTALATQVATALTNARLFEQTQAALAEVEATQRRYLERAWSEYAQTQRVSGYEQAGADLVPLDDALLPEVRQAMQEQRTVVLQEEDGTSVLVVPVILRGQSLGAVGFKIEEEGRNWSADDIALVEGASEQFALAAENIRLLDETQRRAARERLTRDITDKMRRAASVDGIVQTAVDELFGALRTSRTFVRLGVTPSQDDGGDKEESQVKEVASHD